MRIKPKMRVDEIIPNTGISRRKRKMMPWMWGLVGAVCAMVVYCGGIMVYATDWTLVFTEDELVEVGDITGDDQSSGSDKTSGSVDSEEEKPDEKPVEPDPSVPDEKPVQPINPRPNVPIDTPDTQGKKVIALTFDDGPSKNTKAIIGRTIHNTTLIILKSRPAINKVIHKIASNTRLAEREGCSCISTTGIATVMQIKIRVGI